MLNAIHRLVARLLVGDVELDGDGAISASACDRFDRFRLSGTRREELDREVPSLRRTGVASLGANPFHGVAVGLGHGAKHHFDLSFEVCT